MQFPGVPDVVRRRALAAGAEDWLARLPLLIAELEQELSMRVGRAYTGSTEAFVGEVILEDQTPAVLKLLIPRDNDAARNEITALRLAGGNGCARLLRADANRCALLLERLGAPLSDFGLPISRRLEILCTAAERVWRRAPECGLPTGAEKGRWLVELAGERVDAE